MPISGRGCVAFRLAEHVMLAKVDLVPGLKGLVLGQIWYRENACMWNVETGWVHASPVTISLFPTSIDLDPIFEKDRDLDRFRFSYRAGLSVGGGKYFRRAGPGRATSDLMSLSGQGASDDGMSEVR